MRMPSAAQRKLLEKATANYQASLSSASSYLTGRGIPAEMANRWRLGVVASPEPGHEHLKGRLCIPYINKLGVMALKFRCLQSHDHKDEHVSCKKYLALEGQEKYLFNVGDVDRSGSTLHVTEGELDAIILSEALGEPTVGVPGVAIWMEHWTCHFRFERVLFWPDGDRAGKDWTHRIRKDFSSAEFVQLPAGKDVNSVYLESGLEALKELAGLYDT